MADPQKYSRIRYNGSAAYEIAYEPDNDAQQENRQSLQPRPKKAVQTKYGISAFAIVGYVAVAVMLVLVVMTYVQYTTVAAQTVEYREYIETLSSDQRKLTIQYEKTFDLNEIELYAKSVLGMDAPQERQLGEVALNASDKAIVYSSEEQNGIIGSLASAVRTVMAYFN